MMGAVWWLARSALASCVVKVVSLVLAGAMVMMASCTGIATQTLLLPVQVPTGRSVVVLPSVALQPVPTLGPVVPVTNAPLPVGDDLLAAAFVASALTWLDQPVPYLWGGCSRKGVDCSCLVMLNLAAVGIKAPRTTVSQILWTIPLRRADLRPGALLYFDNTCTDCGANPTHVGIVVDAVKGLMIDAGDPVKVESYNTSYWLSRYHSAGWPPGL